MGVGIDGAQFTVVVGADDNTGLPPTISMMITEKLLKVTLVVLDDDAFIIVGIRIIVNNSVVKT